MTKLVLDILSFIQNEREFDKKTFEFAKQQAGRQNNVFHLIDHKFLQIAFKSGHQNDWRPSYQDHLRLIPLQNGKQIKDIEIFGTVAAYDGYKFCILLEKHNFLSKPMKFSEYNEWKLIPKEFDFIYQRYESHVTNLQKNNFFYRGFV